MTEQTELARDHSLEEVADALSMSTRWLRGRIKADDLEHIRYGHKIRFTPEQVEKIRVRYTQAPAPATPVTTGKKKSA